ncbi:MAG: hypothetical protein ACXWJ4_02740 [Methyloceanibacter sp.]|jgi:hypothetical protein
MGDTYIALGVVACLTTFAGCATNSVGEVQEVGPGTYSIGVSRGSYVLSQGAEEMKEAVNKAGEYCHSKGQKLIITPNTGNNVTFHCVPANADNEQREY